MKEEFGNIWDKYADAICITTNGFVKKNGRAVMGRGIAREAAERMPYLPGCLGNLIKTDGNHVNTIWAAHQIYDGESGEVTCIDIASFPVKHNWWEEADIKLIKRSCKELMLVADELATYWKRILLPRPGCGNGKLSWDEVKPAIEPLLDDRVVVVSFKP